MPINAAQLRTLVIRPILQGMGMYSPAAENLLMGIAAHESHLGTFIKQIKGPACGMFQMEPDTEMDLWDNYLLKHRRDLVEVVRPYLSDEPDPLITHLGYQVAMARIKLWRVSEPLPDATDIPALASYWKRHWNTIAGKGTEGEFIANYERFLAGELQP